jgi:hypothetical protein
LLFKKIIDKDFSVRFTLLTEKTQGFNKKKGEGEELMFFETGIFLILYICLSLLTLKLVPELKNKELMERIKKPMIADYHTSFSSITHSIVALILGFLKLYLHGTDFCSENKYLSKLFLSVNKSINH